MFENESKEQGTIPVENGTMQDGAAGNPVARWKKKKKSKDKLGVNNLASTKEQSKHAGRKTAAGISSTGAVGTVPPLEPGKSADDNQAKK